MTQEIKMEQDIMEKMQELDRNNHIENLRRLNRRANKGQILFTGSSLMEQFPIEEISKNRGFDGVIYNRGVGGFRTEDFIENIHEMLLDLEPSKVFINIGTNDLHIYDDGTAWQEHLKHNYDYILRQCQEKLPETKVYVMAYYPMDETNEVGEIAAKMFQSIRTNKILAEASEIAKNLAETYGFSFINVNEGLTNEDGNLKPEYSKDGIHMFADAYEIVYTNLEKYLKE